MAYSYKYDTRNWTYWAAAIASNLLGWPIVIMFGIYGYMEGFKGGPMFAFFIGIWFLIGGFFFIYKIMYPTTYEAVVTDEKIICRKNGEITCEVNKDDIDSISLSLGDFDSIYINLKNNGRHEVGVYFVMDFHPFRKELEQLGYQIKY